MIIAGCALVVGAVLVWPYLVRNLKYVQSDSGLLASVVLLIAGGASIAKLRIPGTPVFTAEVILVVGLLVTAVKYRRLGNAPRSTVFLLVYVVLQSVRALLSIPARADIVDHLAHLGVVEYMLFAYLGVCIGPPSWTRMRGITIAGGQVVGVLSIQALLSGAHSLTINGSNRYLSSNQVAIGSMALIALMLAKDLPKRARSLMAILPAASVLLVYQRTSWLAFLCGIACALFACAPTRLSHVRLNPAKVALVCITIGVFILTPPARLAVAETLGRVTGVQLSRDANVEFRANVQSAELAQWASAPVFGVGYAPVILRASPQGTPVEANGHNGWVTILWRTGLCGLVLTLLLWSKALGSMVRRREPESAFVVGCLVVMMIGSSFNVWLEVPYLAPLAWLFVGYALSESRTSKTTTLVIEDRVAVR
jgi:hypothetical protein